MTQSQDNTETRERLLDAAELEFAEHGFDGASLRGITTVAGANLAAVNYHFGSKEGLFRETFRRRIQPINDERLRRLDRLEAEGAPSLDEIVTAFVAPAMVLRKTPPADPSGAPQTDIDATSSILRLISRLHSETVERVEPLFALFAEVWTRYLAALSRALPGLPEAEVIWRMNFAIGAMSHVVLLRLPKPDAGLRRLDEAASTAAIVAFISAGFRAPATHSPDPAPPV